MFTFVGVSNFYTSRETVFRPDLKGEPIVVVSSNDGCIISRPIEAKSLGIENGKPFFKIENNLYYSSARFFSSSYALYVDLSDRVMQTLTTMSPPIEIYFIDKAFINLSEIMSCAPLSTFGHEIRAHVLENTDLTVGVSITQTRTLAELANHTAETWRGTGGVVGSSSIVRQRRLLALVPVEEV